VAAGIERQRSPWQRQTSAQVRHQAPLLRYFLAGYRHLRLPPLLRLPLRTTNPVAVVVRSMRRRIEPKPSYLPIHTHRSQFTTSEAN